MVTVMDKKIDNGSALLNIEDVCTCLHIGKTNARAFIRDHEHDFVIHIGNRKYVVKKLLDEWLMKEAKK